MLVFCFIKLPFFLPFFAIVFAPLQAAGVKRIKLHSLRHSHISHLIDLGFSAVAIADRVGHESIDITYQYAHLFPTKQMEMAQKLNIERGEEFGEKFGQAR